MTGTTQVLRDRRHREVGFYRDIYAGDRGYGHPAERPARALAFAGEVVAGCRSLLDVSAGRGQFLRLVAAAHPGVNLAASEAVERLVDVDLREFDAFVWALPYRLLFARGRWDVVTCWDVLEHLVPEDTEAALRSLAAVADRYLALSIALFPCGWSGRETHINLRGADEWLRLLAAIPGCSVRRHETRERVLWALIGVDR